MDEKHRTADPKTVRRYKGVWGNRVDFDERPREVSLQVRFPSSYVELDPARPTAAESPAAASRTCWSEHGVLPIEAWRFLGQEKVRDFLLKRGFDPDCLDSPDAPARRHCWFGADLAAASEEPKLPRSEREIERDRQSRRLTVVRPLP